MESTKAEDQLVWFTLYLVLYLAFYFFTSPFVGNRELLNSWTPYVYVSMALYAWLFSAAALHTPVHALGLLDATIKQPISLLFPFFSASFVFLICLEALMMLSLSLLTKRLGLSWTAAHVSLTRSFMNVLRNSAAVSIACVALIVHCDATHDCAASPDEPRTYSGHACEQIFSFVRSDDIETFVPGSYGGAVLIWCMGMFLAITNFVLERWSGIRVISPLSWFSGYVDEDDDEFEEGENGHERLPPEQNLPMVPWYSMLLFDTAFDLLISLKLFLGRFDMRTMQRALHPNDEDYCFDHLADKDEVWLDFMADCGDGFSSSYQIARLLAQSKLEVDCPVNEIDGDSGDEDSSNQETLKKTKTIKRVFPRGDALVIGGDLAYPHPSSSTYETRLFRPFEYAMKPPPSYHPSAISTQKKTPNGCSSLREYSGPTAFAIPGNHDWFDGLNTFTRYICQRDWLGGWLLPQKTSYFSLKLPHGWWLFGVDLALENDVDTEQFGFFERVVETQMGPNDAVIVLTHEPRWLLDLYEDRSNVDAKLAHLIDTILKGRVAVRLAGDIHNYMRHSLVEETNVLKRPASMQFNSSCGQGSTASLPRRHSFSSPVHKHFPHMTQNDDGSSEDRKASDDKLQFDPPADHERSAEHLIISGGGGAFLHPTHVPSAKLNSHGGIYEQKKAYPPVHVSRRYALLNVFGFRRLNWRFDAIGGVGYFALVFSMFPRCSVGSIYAAETWWEMAAQFFQELVQLLCDIVTTSHASLLCSLIMLLGTIGFADCTTLPKRCIMGLTVACCHFVAAFTILLIYECILEVSTVRGALGREGEHTLYLFFSSTLPDFSAVRQYDILGLTSLYGDFMKLCMTIYDVPEMVALHRNKICASGFESLSRIETWTYYASVFPYFWVLATPVVSFIFGTYLYLSLNIFGCHYNEAFSSLRIASYKNFLRLHFDKEGRLEVFVFGVDKMPRRWCRDPKWSGGTGPRASLERKLPSFQWTRPSYWKPLVTKVDNMLRLDFENPSLDTKFNTSDRSNVQLVDRVLVRKPMRSSISNSK